jgi:hypothetical protein
MCDTRAMATRPKRPGDFAQLGKLVVDILTGQRPNDSPTGPEIRVSKVRRAAGEKGGKARAKKLSPKKRKAIAKKAARARWQRDQPSSTS